MAAHGSVVLASFENRHALAGPRVVENTQLNEQAELVGTDPFPDDLAVLEVHNADHPFLHRPSRWGPAHVSKQGESSKVSQSDLSPADIFGESKLS
jgi:hypothetical protein